MGQNQSATAEKLLTEAVNHGRWIIFENCHLMSNDWMIKLESLYINLIESSAEINDDFRWWFILSRTTSFPLIMLRDAIKIAIERPSDWRANMIHQYSSEPMCTEKFFSHAFAQQPPSLATIWYRFVFAINAVHAVMLERLTYGSIGWSQPYDFDDNIRKITLFELRSFLKQSGAIPYESFFYLANDCNYGNEIVDACDRRLLWNLLQRFCNEEVVTTANFKFFDTELLHIPSEPNRENCMEYFDKLPSKTNPLAFGLPNNVEYLRSVNDGNNVSFNKYRLLFEFSTQNTHGKFPFNLAPANGLQNTNRTFCIAWFGSKWHRRWQQRSQIHLR